MSPQLWSMSTEEATNVDLMYVALYNAHNKKKAGSRFSPAPRRYANLAATFPYGVVQKLTKPSNQDRAWDLSSISKWWGTDGCGKGCVLCAHAATPLPWVTSGTSDPAPTTTKRKRPRVSPKSQSKRHHHQDQTPPPAPVRVARPDALSFDREFVCDDRDCACVDRPATFATGMQALKCWGNDNGCGYVPSHYQLSVHNTSRLLPHIGCLMI
jgi:hypothetical protein